MTRFRRQFVMAWVLMFIEVPGFSATARAVEFAGGMGEPNDPYQIATAEQLLSIDDDKELLKKHYILVNSIDLAGRPVYAPVISGFFRGSFDGNGYTIQNLGSEEIPAGGLFMYIWSGVMVKNVGIVNAYVEGAGVLAGTNQGTVQNCYCTGAIVSGTGHAGGLIGVNVHATVTDCYSEAEVSGPNNVGGLIGGSSGVVSRCHSSGKVVGDFNNVGGLIGSANGEISFCYSTSEVCGLNSVGGLLGANSGGSVSDCYSTGGVRGTGNDTGGLIGFNRGGLSRCHSTSLVIGKMYVGGLAGTNKSNIAQIVSCYADANVVSEDLYAGGLVGYNWAGSIESCYCTGIVSGPDYVGGLVGYSDEESSIVTSYTTVTVTASEDALCVGALAGEGTAENSYFLDGGPDNGVGIPLTDSEMKQQASFIGWDFSGASDDGEADLWFMPEDAYPILIWQAEITDPNDDAPDPNEG